MFPADWMLIYPTSWKHVKSNDKCMHEYMESSVVIPDAIRCRKSQVAFKLKPLPLQSNCSAHSEGPKNNGAKIGTLVYKSKGNSMIFNSA
jgi:hypothetical protein